MISRNAMKVLEKLALGFPAVSITGPRQSGKTTLAQHVFSDKTYVTLEDLDIREQALDDPRGFLAQFPDGAVLDEVQRCPDLFSYIQGIVDKVQALLAGSWVYARRSRLAIMQCVTRCSKIL